MTTQTAITKDEINAVYPTVAETIADALGCEVDEVKPDASLIEDLGAESMLARRPEAITLAQGVPLRGARRSLPYAAQGEGRAAAVHPRDVLQARDHRAAAGHHTGVIDARERGTAENGHG